MDQQKCAALKDALEGQPEPQLVPIDQFFDGNDDEGSIGCNLVPHPGMTRFRETLVALARRQDVTGVFAAITELDPGEDAWPFTDTILVTGSIDPEALSAAIAGLEPDEVGPADPALLGTLPPQAAKGSVFVAWWD